jgi:5'-deoxynucleotidase YfbR-like HD superfamily hydrolase
MKSSDDFDMGSYVAALMAGSINRMSHVYRYSSVPVIRKENVAEHSWYVAFYSFFLAQALNKEGYKIDYGKLLSRALVHDLDESMTGDFLRHIKYGHSDLKRVLDEVSVTMIHKIQEDLGTEFEDIWASAKANDIEGDIVSVVDLARVLSYVYEEVKLGNRHVAYILDECCDYISKFVATHEKSPVLPYAVALVQWARGFNHE